VLFTAATTHATTKPIERQDSSSCCDLTISLVLELGHCLAVQRPSDQTIPWVNQSI